MEMSSPEVGEGASVGPTLLTVGMTRARVFVGGDGPPVVLVHGGWGGASPHWSAVWQPLAERFRVIAPDLPGIGDTTQPGLDSVGDYARWLAGVLDALDVPRAWLVGNSFGASVVSRFALDFPDRCRGLVFVNGFPMPETPRPLRWLGERRLGQRLVRALEKRVAYAPGTLRRGFFDPAKAPEDIRRSVRQGSPALVATLAKVIVRGGGAQRRTYPAAPLLLWGEEDRLPGTSRDAARKLCASWPGSTLAFVPRAGHMPQVENPAAFVDALASFIARDGS